MALNSSPSNSSTSFFISPSLRLSDGKLPPESISGKSLTKSDESRKLDKAFST